MSRGADAIPCEGNELDNVNIAIYVKMSLPDCDQLRRDYLQYMGSNIESFCPIHQFPCTTCPLGGGKVCGNRENNSACTKQQLAIVLFVHARHIYVILALECQFQVQKQMKLIIFDVVIVCQQMRMPVT